MSASTGNRRFSLLSLVLLVTTVAALAGWIGAQRQASRARLETLRLRQQLQQYRAELGQLQVVDKTRVHAIGVRRDPNQHNRWKWRVYLPTDRQHRLVLETDQRQSVEIPETGERIIEAQLAPGADDTWWISLAVDGTPLMGASLPWYTDQTELSFPSMVGPNDRSVWEQTERPVLIKTMGARPDDSNSAEPEVDRPGFTIWIESPRTSPLPQGQGG